MQLFGFTPGFSGKNGFFFEIFLEELCISRNIPFVSQCHSVETPDNGRASRHAQIKIPDVAVSQNEKWDAIIDGISEYLLFTLVGYVAQSFGFDENQRASTMNECVIYSAIV